MDPVSCVLCDAKLDDATSSRGPKMRARGPTGAARLLESCQAREQRSRTPSCSPGPLRTHPARAARRRKRSGDNSPRIGRTTAKWHSTPAPKSRSSARDASSWLLSPRDDASRREPRGCKVPVRTYGGTEQGCVCVGKAAKNHMITQSPVTGSEHEPQSWRSCSQLCTRQPPDADQGDSKTHSTVPQQPTRSIAATERRKRRKKRC